MHWTTCGLNSPRFSPPEPPQKMFLSENLIFRGLRLRVIFYTLPLCSGKKNGNTLPRVGINEKIRPPGQFAPLGLGVQIASGGVISYTPLPSAVNYYITRPRECIEKPSSRQLKFSTSDVVYSFSFKNSLPQDLFNVLNGKKNQQITFYST